MADLTPTARTCATRAIKEAKHRALHPGVEPPRAGAQAAAPLFSGTVHLVRLTFDTPSGPVGVDAADHAVALQFLQLAAPPITAYATQYGPNSIAIDPAVGVDTVTPPGGTTYSDADLAGWVDQYAQAHAIPAGDAVSVLNPPSGVENTDAPASQGVLGYHNVSPGGVMYTFVNAMGSGFTLDDAADVYAFALAHETEEMTVDPQANLSNPEVSDPCSGNCGVSYRDYFDASGNYINSGSAFPPGYPYAFFVSGFVTPAQANACPAPAAACAYPPPGTPGPGPAPPPNPTACLQEIGTGVEEFLAGNTTQGIVDVENGIYCLLDSLGISVARFALHAVKDDLEKLKADLDAELHKV
ncbi:MAG: hypothetical protein IVW52_04950 [Acidimicrobiales bacterium]|nr:hypothetical protein [Acidimicrobiales bacterium]